MIGISCCAWVFEEVNNPTLQQLREVGYELIDVRPDTLAKAALSQAADLGFQVNCMGITLHDSDTLHSKDPQSVDAALDIVNRSCELASSIGTSVAYVIPGQDSSAAALTEYGESISGKSSTK